MSRYTSQSAQTKLAVVACCLGAAALGSAGLEMLTAPTATASPAPASTRGTTPMPMTTASAMPTTTLS
jgi:hypothetical protein